MSVFKACDIRGVVPDEWDAPFAGDIGSSLGAMLVRRGESAIVVGGDFRRTTPAIKGALVDGLVGAGLLVHDLGQLPTPAAYLGARHLDVANVAVVTASHNPGRYNGVKVMVQGRPATGALVEEIERGMGLAASDNPDGSVVSHDLVPQYEQRLAVDCRSLVGRDEHDSRLRTVVDSMEGATTHIAPRVLAAAGHSVHAIYDTMDPDFSGRAPNPARDENLSRLAAEVVERKADVGVALDGDGDRVVLVTHAGDVVRPEQVAALLMERCFDSPTIVYDLKCASIVPRATLQCGGTAIMRPSGYGFIKEAIIDEDADLGVEASGHHFYRLLGGGDDGLLTALVILHLVAASGQSLAKLIEPYPWPAITPDIRIPFDGDMAATLDTIAAAATGEVSRLDGVRAEYGSGWALARASITEPVISLRFEGSDPDDMKRIAGLFLAPVPDLRAKVQARMEKT